MEPSFVVGNMVWNAGLVGVAAYFIKKWVDKVETTSTQNRTDAMAMATELFEQVKGINIEMKLANGRTARIEGKVEVQAAICRERHNGHEL